MKKPAPRSAAKSRPAAGLWPAFTPALLEGDAVRAEATFAHLLGPDETGLVSSLAQPLGKQFLRLTAAARKRAARPLEAAGIAAAREIVGALETHGFVAAILGARSPELTATHALLAPAEQRKFAAALTRVSLAVAREPGTADVHVLMTAALDGLLRDAPVPKKRKRA